MFWCVAAICSNTWWRSLWFRVVSPVICCRTVHWSKEFVLIMSCVFLQTNWQIIAEILLQLYQRICMVPDFHAAIFWNLVKLIFDFAWVPEVQQDLWPIIRWLMSRRSTFTVLYGLVYPVICWYISLAGLFHLVGYLASTRQLRMLGVISHLSSYLQQVSAVFTLTIGPFHCCLWCYFDPDTMACCCAYMGWGAGVRSPIGRCDVLLVIMAATTLAVMLFKDTYNKALF